MARKTGPSPTAASPEAEPGRSVKPVPAEIDREESPPGVAALPAAVFAELPERRIMAHVYRPDPERRFVVVNSQKLREGDSSRAGLVIEKILPGGVIFGFRGHRFYMPR